MATPDRGAIPKFAMPVTAEALQRLPLDPTDGFVLSRIDGHRSYDELVRSTGLSSEVVGASLVKLARLGVVSGIDVPESPAASRPSLRTTEEVADGVDLDADHKIRILDTFERLDELDHYELLGLTRDADKKAVKRAYFELAGVFHPDRFFRKELGDYKPKMVAIFARATEAHDVLTNKAKRTDHDAYLRDLALTRQFEGPEGPTAPTKTVASGPPEPSGSAPRIEIAADHGPRSSPHVVPGQQVPVPTIPIPSEPIDPRARRDALARRLLGGRASLQPPPGGSFGPPSFGPSSFGPPSSGPASGPVPSSGRGPASDGANGPNSVGPRNEVLRHHYEQRLADVKRTQALRHVEEARLAKANGDRAHAIERLRLALTFTPEDADLRRRVADETAEMETDLIDTYRRQATYEEEHGRFVDAARSWTHLARLQHEDPEVNDQAARAHLKAGGALHQARFFAQRAVTLSPMEAAYRATLGLVYLEAGLTKNARRELEAAEQLAPQDASIAALLKRLGPEVP